jgi:Septum formation
MSALLVCALLSGTMSCADNEPGGSGLVSSDPIATPPSQPSSTTSSTTPVADTVASTNPVVSDSVVPTETDLPLPPVPSTIEELELRDCFNVGADTRVVIANCEELHDGQILRIDVPLDGVDPSDPSAEVWLQAARIVCVDHFEEFVGAALDSANTIFTIAPVVTDVATPPVIACAAVHVANEQWAGTAERITGSYVGIEVGDCFDFPTQSSNAREISCDEPHEAEMFLVDASLGLDLPEAPYPSQDEWYALSETICDEAFGTYTGQPIAEATDLSYTFVYTLEGDWDDVANRNMSCAVVSFDGTRRVGSTRI